MPVEEWKISQVLEKVRAEFPDLSLSKLRFLDNQGLISPERLQSSGYRRFTQKDIDRLLYVLRAQRDRYLPLKVIREELEAIDRGEEPMTAPPPATEPVMPEPPPERTQQKVRVPASQLFTRRQVLVESGIPEASLIHLERMRLVEPRRGSNLYGREAIAVASAAKRLAHYGLDLRQLRVVKDAASTEVALIEQILEPYRRRNGYPSECMADVCRSIMQAHLAFLHGQFNV